MLLVSALAAVTISGPASTAAAATAGAQAVAPPPVLTAEQWRQDLRFLAAEMQRRHKNLYHTVSPETFAAAVADLDARIPSLGRDEIIVGMMRIAALVGDGHSRMDTLRNPAIGFPSLPLKLYLFEDGLYVRAAAPEYAALVGARIEAIGGVPAAEAIRRVEEIISSDNESGAKMFAPLYLDMPDILHALKMCERPDAAEFKLRKGSRSWTATVPAGAVEPDWPGDTDVSFVTPKGWTDARTAPQPPTWLADPLDLHRLVEMPERKALYAQLNMVSNIEGETLGEFGKKIRARAEATNPRAVILDLRLNRGGNGDLRSPLVRELIKTEDEDTHLYVLTARGTFSASQFILDDLDRLTDAVFIGEPAGSKPNSYGDGYSFRLPNSGIKASASIYWWQAGQRGGPWTETDVAAPLTFADYAAGRDPALEAAIGYAPGAPLQDRLLQAAKVRGAEGVREALGAYRSDPANRYLDFGLKIPIAAERLYVAKQPGEAFVVAQIAAQDFPDSVEAAIILAIIAERTNHPDVALQAGRRTLELDPNNRQARDLVARLGSAKG